MSSDRDSKAMATTVHAYRAEPRPPTVTAHGAADLWTSLLDRQDARSFAQAVLDVVDLAGEGGVGHHRCRPLPLKQSDPRTFGCGNGLHRDSATRVRVSPSG